MYMYSVACQQNNANETLSLIIGVLDVPHLTDNTIEGVTDVLWSKDNIMLKNQHHYEIKSGPAQGKNNVVKSTLTIRNFTNSDQGTYNNCSFHYNNSLVTSNETVTSGNKSTTLYTDCTTHNGKICVIDNHTVHVQLLWYYLESEIGQWIGVSVGILILGVIVLLLLILFVWYIHRRYKSKSEWYLYDHIVQKPVYHLVHTLLQSSMILYHRTIRMILLLQMMDILPVYVQCILKHTKRVVNVRHSYSCNV